MDEAQAKTNLFNTAVLATEGDRKAAAEAEKIKTILLANSTTSVASKAAVSPYKKANKRQNPFSDSEDEGTIVNMLPSNYLAHRISQALVQPQTSIRKFGKSVPTQRTIYTPVEILDA